MDLPEHLKKRLFDERIVWESTRRIATKLNLSPTTVGECIKHLESAGLLKVQRAKGKPNLRSARLERQWRQIWLRGWRRWKIWWFWVRVSSRLCKGCYQSLERRRHRRWRLWAKREWEDDLEDRVWVREGKVLYQMTKDFRFFLI